MEVKAIYKNAAISPQKARLVASLIKKMKVSSALDVLNHTTKKAAILIKKVLDSAVSNAEHNYGLDIDNLLISSIYVNKGMVLKRFMPRSKGRANKILKRSCHITIKLAEKA